MDPKYATKLGDLERAVLESAGTLDPAIRKAAAEGAPVPEALAGYVDKVRRHAYRVTDGDVERLLGAGYSQDQIFEDRPSGRRESGSSSRRTPPV